MNRIKRWLLKRLIAEQVIQGWDHDERIEGLFCLIQEAALNEFTEDNLPTINSYLRDRFYIALSGRKV